MNSSYVPPVHELSNKDTKLKRIGRKQAVCKECERLLEWPMVSFEKSRIGGKETPIVQFGDDTDEERYEIHLLLSHGMEK